MDLFSLEYLSELIAQNFNRPEIAIPIYFLAGLISGFLPCMLPVIPITVGFLRNRKQAKTNKSISWQGPMIYCMGILICYLLLGALTVLTSSSFSVIVRNPYFLLLLGSLFILLALSSLELISFQKIFSHLSILQSKLDMLFQKTNRLNSPFFSILFMGFIAGILVSACASPVLISMFLFLAKSSSTNMASLWYKVFYGSMYSVVFGLGISIPLMIAGLLSLRIPHQGKWSIGSRWLLGIAILLVGVYEIYNGIQILRKQNNSIVIQQASDRSEEIGSLVFYRNFYYGLSQAANQQLPIFIDFYGEWCSNCKAFDQTLKSDVDLQNILNQVIKVKIYDTDTQFIDFQNNPDYPELKISLPLYAILRSDGTLYWKTVNYQNTKGIIDNLQDLLSARQK